MQIAAVVVKGVKPQVAAKRFGLSVSSVYRCCRESGFVLQRSDAVGRLAEAKARRRLVKALLKQGLPPATVAEQVGLRTDSVRRIKRQENGSRGASLSRGRISRAKSGPLSSRLPKRSFSERAERRAKIAAAVAGGLTTEQAAADFGVSRGLVYYSLNESGLELRQGSSTGAVDQAIVQLAIRSNPAETIARKLGVPVSRVQSVCRRRRIRLVSPGDRINAARLLARRHALGNVDLVRLLDGKHVNVLKALRDTELSLSEIGARFRLPTQRVFAIWAEALHRLAVPEASSHAQFVKARRRVLQSGLSFHALLRGRRQKLIRRMRDSNLSMADLAHNARTSEYDVWRIWHLALDRAAIAAARSAGAASKPTRKRRTSRDRRVLRDLVL